VRLLALVLVLAACAPEEHGPGIDVDRAMAHVDALTSIGPRPGDSEPARAAAAYIEHELPVAVERLPVGAIDLPEISVLGTTYRHARRVTTTDPDLVVRFGPPGNVVLIMAHYDTVAGSPGAADNAAAVGVLIELARVLATQPPGRPVMLAFTANEEIGLVGAEALAAARGDRVDIAIALDLIGGSGPLVLNGASELIGRVEMSWLAAAADRAGIVMRAPFAHRVVSRWWPQAERSDHGPFTRRGVRAFHLYDRGQDGERIDLAYHSERDVADRVVPDSLDEVGRLLRALIAEPLGPHDGDGVWLPVATNTVVPRWVVVAACAAILAAALGLLVQLRRPLVPGRLGLFAAIGVYAIAVAATWGLEYVFSGDHPAPWMHAPLRWLIGELLVLGGVLGLVTRLAGRLSPWRGDLRYLALGALAELAIGAAWLVGGAAELAWIWLVPGLALAIAPRLGRFAAIAVIPTLLPVALVLGPDQVREAAWNGFMTPQIPLVTWIATLSFPIFAGAGWYLRSRARSGPLGTLALSMGCLLAMITGTIVLGTNHPPCSAAQFHEFRLACEQIVEVR